MARKGNKKVRTGCRTCKIRKVKCDEEKPACRRCTSTGRKCDGYDLARLGNGNGGSPRGPTDLELSEMVAQKTAEALFNFFYPRRSNYPSTTADWAEGETRAIQFFQEVAGPTLSCGFDSDFWNGLVLQFSQGEPAVRHALAAVSSLYEQFQDPEGWAPDTANMARNPFAIKQYSSAIRQLANSKDESVALLTCILFVCLEFLQHNKQAAIDHCRHGVLILNNMPEVSPWIRRHLLPVFRRLSIFPYFFGNTVGTFPALAENIRHPDTPFPNAFSSLADVQHSLDELVGRTMRFVRLCDAFRLGGCRALPIPAPLTDDQQRIREAMRAWDETFVRFKAELPVAAAVHVCMDHLLQMRFLIARIWMESALERSETTFDRHLDDFVRVAELARVMQLHLRRSNVGSLADAGGLEGDSHGHGHVHAHATTTASGTVPVPVPGTGTAAPSAWGEPTSGPCPALPIDETGHRSHRSRSRSPPCKIFPQVRPRFVFEMGVMPLLYFTIIRCRDLPTRLDALASMTELAFDREGLFDVGTMSCVGRRVIEKEHGIDLNGYVRRRDFIRLLGGKVGDPDVCWTVPEERRIWEAMILPDLESHPGKTPDGGNAVLVHRRVRFVRVVDGRVDTQDEIVCVCGCRAEGDGWPERVIVPGLTGWLRPEDRSELELDAPELSSSGLPSSAATSLDGWEAMGEVDVDLGVDVGCLEP